MTVSIILSLMTLEISPCTNQDSLSDIAIAKSRSDRALMMLAVGATQEAGGDSLFVPFWLTCPAALDTTSGQCVGCHAAGATGLRFDLTVQTRLGGLLVNLASYGE